MITKGSTKNEPIFVWAAVCGRGGERERERERERYNKIPNTLRLLLV